MLSLISHNARRNPNCQNSRIKSGRSSLLSLFCLCYVTISDLFLEFDVIVYYSRWISFCLDQ
jgi:hypothetical protein